MLKIFGSAVSAGLLYSFQKYCNFYVICYILNKWTLSYSGLYEMGFSWHVHQMSSVYDLIFA